MKKIDQCFDLEKTHAKMMFLMKAWILTERIHFREESWGVDPTTRAGLLLLSDDLCELTLEEASALYSLLLPTQTILKTSEGRTVISQLSSKLSALKTLAAQNSDMSAYQSFSDAVQFISTLSSGGYPMNFAFRRGELVALHGSGARASSM